MTENAVGEAIIGAAIRVHSALAPGFLLSPYGLWPAGVLRSLRVLRVHLARAAMTCFGVSAERVLTEGDDPSLPAFVAVIVAPAALGDALQRRLGVDRARPRRLQ